MEKFIVLHSEGIPGAIIGTESGSLLAITREDLNNELWMNEYLSTKLRVFKIKETPMFYVAALPAEVMADIKEPLSMKFVSVRINKFEVILNVAFSPSANALIFPRKFGQKVKIG